MVRSVLFSVGLLSGLVWAAPQGNPDGDSALGEEVAVSAPFGIPLSDTSELAAQLGTAFTPPATIAAPQPTLATWPSNAAPSAAPAVAPVYAPPIVEATRAYSTQVWAPAVTAPSLPPPVTYGSGSSSYVNSFDSCVQQCQARFGPPLAGSPPPSPTEIGEIGGSGATHTVIVAPSAGVLRYVPFAINASVGDTVRFEWRADNHYVARSSILLPCNGTQDNTFFNSGKRNNSFVFNQVVNDTNPIFYFCATGTHCQQGMFGVINAGSNLVGPSSLGAMMTDIAAANPQIATAWADTNSKTANTAAFGWGNSIDLAGMPEWSHALVAENALYNRQLFAKNPEVMQKDGSIDMGALRGPLMVPPELNLALSANTPATTLSLAPLAAATAGAGGAPAAAPVANPQGAAAPAAPVTNGARSLGTSGSIVALVAVISTLLAL